MPLMKQQRIDTNKFKSAPVQPGILAKKLNDKRWSDPPGLLREPPGLPHAHSFRVRGTFIEDVIYEEPQRPKRRAKSAEQPRTEQLLGREDEDEKPQDPFSFEQDYVRELSEKLNTLWKVDEPAVEPATSVPAHGSTGFPEEKVTSHSVQVAVVVDRLQREFFESEKSTRLGRDYFASGKSNRLMRDIFESRRSNASDYDTLSSKALDAKGDSPTQFDSASTRVTTRTGPRKNAGVFDSRRTRFGSEETNTFSSHKSAKPPLSAGGAAVPPLSADEIARPQLAADGGNAERKRAYDQRVQSIWSALDEGSDLDEDEPPPLPFGGRREEALMAAPAAPSQVLQPSPPPMLLPVQPMCQVDMLPPVQPMSHAFPQAQPVSQAFPQMQPVSQAFPQVQPVSQAFPQVQPVSQACPQVLPVSQACPQVQPVSQAVQQVPAVSHAVPPMQPLSPVDVGPRAPLISKAEAASPLLRRVPMDMPPPAQHSLQVDTFHSATRVAPYEGLQAASQPPPHGMPTQMGDPMMAAGMPQQAFPMGSVQDFQTPTHSVQGLPFAFAPMQATAQDSPNLHGQAPQVVHDLAREARPFQTNAVPSHNAMMKSQQQNPNAWPVNLAHLASRDVCMPAPGLTRHVGGEWAGNTPMPCTTPGGHLNSRMGPCASLAAGSCANRIDYSAATAPAHDFANQHGQVFQVAHNFSSEPRPELAMPAPSQNLRPAAHPEYAAGLPGSVGSLAPHDEFMPAPGLVKQGGNGRFANEALGPQSPGSVGHPNLCMRPCVFFAAGNCPNGVECGFCHMEHPTRPMHLDKRNREKLKSLSFPQCVYTLEPLLRQKASEAGIEPMTADLFAIMCASADQAASASGVPQKQSASSAKQLQTLLRALGAMNFISLIMVVINRPDAPPVMKSEAISSMIERARRYQMQL